MEDFEIKTYKGPEVYPVRGRIADDKDCLAVARQMVDKQLRMDSPVQFRGRTVPYIKVHKPWGYKDPFGKKIIPQEPTRALFGAQMEIDVEIGKLAAGIADRIYETVASDSNRHKFLNYMFRYAPDRLRNDLRKIYSSDDPAMTWNTVYAVGRTFYSAEDFEVFVDFFLRKSKDSGYPEYPDAGFTSVYFWAYFRALCYYEDTVNIPSEKAQDVLRCLFRYAKYRHKRGWAKLPHERYDSAKNNCIKYLLCTILFSCRFRRPCRQFLGLNSELHKQMVSAAKSLIPMVKYPPAMFAVPQPDKLNDYVLRFLNEEQSDQDLSALKGLILTV